MYHNNYFAIVRVYNHSIEISNCYWFSLAVLVCFLIGILFEFLLSLKDKVSVTSDGYNVYYFHKTIDLMVLRLQGQLH